MKKTATPILLAAALSALPFLSAQAESIDGFLERGPQYSALFMVSSESGDLIGQAFKNSSAVGKNILNHCLPGMRCTIARGQMTTIDPQIEALLSFEDHRPSGYWFITSADDISMEAAAHFYQVRLDSRYGRLHIDEENQQLFFRDQLVTEAAPVAAELESGNFFQRIWRRIMQFIFSEKPAQVAIEGNNRLRLVASFENKAEDIIVLQNSGGNACPALFRFATISEKGIHVSPEFGTCSDIFVARPSKNDDQAITLTMTGFDGQFEPTAQQQSHLTKVVYHYAKNSLTKD